MWKTLGHIGYAFLAVFILLSLGRFLGLPIFMALVVSPSMVPSIYPGDLVIFATRGYGAGDVVIWCSSPIYCISHRVVNLSNDLVVTKGDANPIPDQPVPRSLVRGVAVLVIPRWIWIPSAATPIAIYGFRRLGRGSIPFGPLAVLAMLLTYILGSSAYILLIPASPYLVEGLSVPSVELRGVWIYNGSVYIELIPRNVSIAGVDWCEYRYGSHSRACTPNLSSGTIYFEIPGDVFRGMNVEGISRIDVRISASLSLPGGGAAKLVSWNYSLFHRFREPEVRVSGGRVEIYNPNPGCLDVNITSMVADRPGEPWRSASRLVCIDPYGSYTVDLSGHRYAFIRVEYILMGSRQLIQKEVIRDYGPA